MCVQYIKNTSHYHFEYIDSGRVSLKQKHFSHYLLCSLDYTPIGFWLTQWHSSTLRPYLRTLFSTCFWAVQQTSQTLRSENTYCLIGRNGNDLFTLTHHDSNYSRDWTFTLSGFSLVSVVEMSWPMEMIVMLKMIWKLTEAWKGENNYCLCDVKEEIF